jgi:hypothetical protein
MDNVTHKTWSKGKEIKEPIGYEEEKVYREHEIEIAIPISQNQLNDAKLFNSKYEYAKTLDKKISYLEVGVGWGQSAQMFIDITEAKSADLLDLYNNAEGVRHPGGSAPTNDTITHEQYIKNKFSYHPNVNTIKGNINDLLFTLNKKYDFILFDSISTRLETRRALKHCSKLINVNGVIGFTSYMNYDAIHYSMHVGIYQSVNEFLYFNKNWSVDGIVLHDLGFHEIYIKRNS